ncbi:MAG: DUF4290 domain-containing protein [Prevotella sp.]|nr:DUF4290 domain-containing protein [Prevotella sp.]
MNIEGLDYNTQREKLVLPEYGREIQCMVDYAVAVPDKAERQRCATAIVGIMKRMVPQDKGNAGYEQKLWDHLALMSNFQLDIDWPYDISGAQRMKNKPEPMAYPMKDIPVRHYGNMLFELFEKLKTMPEGKSRAELVRMTANQMKRNLVQWSHGSAENAKVASDLERFTDGAIQIDPDQFKFEKVDAKDFEQRTAVKRKKRP